MWQVAGGGNGSHLDRTGTRDTSLAHPRLHPPERTTATLPLTPRHCPVEALKGTFASREGKSEDLKNGKGIL